jgi:hypothetical protein
MSKFCYLFILGLVAAFFLVLLSPEPGVSSSGRTLTRTEDFVVITGADVSGLDGAEVSDLRLYSCKGAGCSPIPLQVDKRDSFGRYVFQIDKYLDADRDGTRLDSNDEICFMAEDSGDKSPASWKPEAAAKGVEIELRDPLDGGKAWVYLIEEPGTSPPETADYVGYVIEDKKVIISSGRFRLGYRAGKINYDLMQMNTSSGDMGKDILDKQRVGLMAQMAKYNMPINIPENIIKTVDTAFIDGPIRVIINQRLVINLADIALQYGSEYFMVYYRCGQNNSVFFDFPLGLNKAFKSMVFKWSLDFTPDIIGSKYLDPHHPQPIPIKPEVVKEVPADQPHYWWGLYGEKGAVLQAIDLDDELIPYFECDGLWNQDPEAKDKRGDFPGRIEIGLACREVGSLPEQKDFHWFNYIMFPENSTLTGLKDLKKIFENPLEVSARKIY